MKHYRYVMYCILVCLLTGIAIPDASSQQPIKAFTSGTPITKQYPESSLRNKTFVGGLVDSAIALYKIDPNKAASVFDELFQISIRQRFEIEASETFGYLVEISNNKGLYDASLNLMKKTQTIAQQYHMNTLLAVVYNSLGNRFKQKGQYDSAMHFYYQALSIAEADTVTSSKLLPTIYTNLSGVLDYTGESGKAIQYLDKAEPLIRKAKNWYLLSLSLINKSSALQNLDRYKESIPILKEALQLAKAHQYLQWEHLALSNLGGAYMELKSYSTALAFLEEAVQLKGDINPKYQNINLGNMGEIYFGLKDYPKAERYWLQMLRSAQGLNMPSSIAYADRMLGELYSQTGDYKKAFNYYKDYALLKDTVLTKDMLERNSLLEVKYQTAQKNKEIAESKLEITKKQIQLKNRDFWIAIISAGALLLMAVTALLYALYRNSNHQKKIQEEKVKTLHREQELQKLKAIMQGEEKTRTRIAQDLHDGIGGMLASIKMSLSAAKLEHHKLSSIPAIENISVMLSETATEVRKTAHNLMPDILERRGLKEVLMYYCGNNSHLQLQIDLQYDVDTVFSKNAELYLYRIIQELLQNITKHARATHVVLQLMQHGEMLNITMEDNGVGFDPSLESNEGIGLRNLRSRLEALNGYFSISSSPDEGTTVYIEIGISNLQSLN